MANSSSVTACSRGYPFRLNELFTADFIVRATAVKYIVPFDPKKPVSSTPESTIEFRTEEKIWGADIPKAIELHGYLTDQDDFNEVPLPYRFVRPGGREGMCQASIYKKGAQFLLFVKRNAVVMTSTGYTTNISALGPTNEQLRGPNDPWLLWVKSYLSPCAKQSSGGTDYADRPKTDFDKLLNASRSDLEKYRVAKCYLVKYGSEGATATRYLEVVEFYETIPQQK